MDVTDMSFANLKQQDLDKVRALEAQLREEIKREIILVAYESPLSDPPKF